MVLKNNLRPKYWAPILCVLILLISTLPHEVFSSKPKRETKSILLDQSVCPLGWQPAGDTCIRLFFNPTTSEEAKQECANHGAELVNIVRNEQENKALLNDITDLLNEPIAAGITELTWLVGGMNTVLENPQLSYNLWVSTKADEEHDKSLALQRKVDRHFELITVATTSSYPYVCSLLPLTRKTLLYEQALFPRGLPQIIEKPKLAYHYASRPDSYFVTIPCKAIGTPVPQIKWFKSGVEEINLDTSNTSYIISGGSLLIPINKDTHDSTAYHCSASNIYGTVRSASTILRSAFIEPFRKTRMDVYPLNIKGTGTRIECQTPQHYPKSNSFTWMYGGHTDQFVSQSERVFISMEGTLYFSYNKKEDATSYACSLSLPSIQSGHYGPFFNLILPQSVPGSSSAPKIDEFQPQIFPEIPTIGEAVFIECFAYGFPAPKYKWSRVDGELLSTRHRILNYGRVLKIDTVTADDAARYKCIAFNELGRESAEIQLVVHSPPTILKPPINQRVATNTSATFECVAATQYSTQLNIEWFHDGYPISPLLMPANERRRFKINDNSLNILNIAEQDSGIYQCIVSNDVGVVSSSARLTVEDAPPKFHGNIFPRRMFVVEGSKLTLPCLYMASPRGFAHWYSASSSNVISMDSRARIRQHKEPIGGEATIAVLEIDNIEKGDEGIYHCETTNGVGEGRGEVHIKVVPKPHIVIRPPSLASGMASNAVYQSPSKITCEVELACELPEDCPEALFDWQFNDQELRHIVTRNVPLKITAKEKTVESYWTENEGRTSRWLFSTSATEESKPENEKRKVKRVRQLSQVEVSPEFSSANIGRFSCTSIYGSGSSELTEPKALSAAPTQLKIVEVKHNHAKLSWKQPANQKRRGFGTSIRMEGYQIEYRTASNRQWRPFPNGLFKTEDRIIGSYLIRNLASNKKYQFRVRTRTVDGSVSAPSLPTEWIETPQSPPLDPIQKLQWRTIDDNHLLLEWDPVEINHQSGPNLRYNVTWSDPAPSIPALSKMNTETFSHSELVSEPNIVIPLKVYKPKKKKIRKNKNKIEDVTESCFTLAVGVQPMNDIGSGPTSTDTVVQISTEGPRRYADNLLAIPVNSTHLNLTWEWKNAAGCENIIGAYIQCLETKAFINDGFALNHSLEDELTMVKKVPLITRDNEDLMVNQSVPAHYTSWLVHDLKPGTEYSCTIQAFDQYGRYGNSSKHAASARTLDPAPRLSPEITRIKLQEMDDSLTTLIEWTSIPLRNSLYDNVTDHQRGYKILIYVSETAEKPVVLTLTEAELQNPRKPSARIDGLKLMYYYTIKVAGFNEGGMGPPSKPTSLRLGMSGDLSSRSSYISPYISVAVMCLIFAFFS